MARSYTLQEFFLHVPPECVDHKHHSSEEKATVHLLEMSEKKTSLKIKETLRFFYSNFFFQDPHALHDCKVKMVCKLKSHTHR